MRPAEETGRPFPENPPSKDEMQRNSRRGVPGAGRGHVATSETLGVDVPPPSAASGLTVTQLERARESAATLPPLKGTPPFGPLGAMPTPTALP